MLELRSLETHILIDLLVAQMDKYTTMLSEGTSEEEFARCSLTIKALQTEIESRKQKTSNTSATDSHLLYPE